MAAPHGDSFYWRYGNGAGQRLYPPLPERLAQGTQINEVTKERPWYRSRVGWVKRTDCAK